MSYEHGTDFLNLPQTVGTDKRDWFDTNEAFRDLDAKLRTAYEGVGTAEAEITELNTRVDNVQTVTQQNVEDISALRTDLATTDERVATNSNAISTLTTEVHEQTTDLEDMIEVSEEASATAENAHAVGSYFRYNNNLWRTTVAIRVGDEIVPDVNCETTDVMSRIELLEGQAPTPQTSEIDDTVIALNKTWSSSKISTELGTLSTAIGSKCADSKVGNLADLDTTDKTAIVAAINELYGMIKEGGGAMPMLNWGTPLHTFNTAGEQYTVPSNCYLAGNYKTGSSTALMKIDGTTLGTTAGTGDQDCIIEGIPIKAGTVISLENGTFPDMHLLAAYT